jgi:hypothetical protein
MKQTCYPERAGDYPWHNYHHLQILRPRIEWILIEDDRMCLILAQRVKRQASDVKVPSSDVRGVL